MSLKKTDKNLYILQDDSDDKKRAILVASAKNIDLHTFNNFLTIAKGIVFVAINSDKADALLLDSMPSHSSKTTMKALVSVDARDGVTTGISAEDRLKAIKIISAEKLDPYKLVKPGHIFPVVVNSGGVLVKHALAEAAYDLIRINQNDDTAVFMDLLNDTGELMNEQDQQKLSKIHKLPIITINELVLHRLKSEKIVYKVAEAKLPTAIAGELKTIAFRSLMFEGEHLALIKGDLNTAKPVLVRMHSEKTFDDIFGTEDNKSKYALTKSLEIINRHNSGVLVYIRKPETNSLSRQINNSNEDHTRNQMRDYGLGAQILRELNITKINLITNSPKTLLGLDTFGIKIENYQGFG